MSDYIKLQLLNAISLIENNLKDKNITKSLLDDLKNYIKQA